MLIKKLNKSLRIDQEVQVLYTRIFLYVLTSVITILIAISRTGLLSRFPGEDLFWNDLQLYNSWRWFSETAKDTGVLSTFSSVIDFRQNTGDLFAASSKWSNPILDIGSWFTYFFGSYSLAFYLKFSTLALISAFGLYKLVQGNFSLQQKSESFKLMIFSILYSSLVFHPILHGEVGPLNQWYLLLVPNWFHILIELTKSVDRKFTILHPYFFTITILSLGSSDLFLISSVTAVFSIFIIKELISGHQAKYLLKYYLLFLGIFLLDKSFYLRESIVGRSQIASKGSWNLEQYTSQFLFPLFREGTFFPIFVGPASIFINAIIFAMCYSAFKNRKNSHFTKYIIGAALTLTLLILSSLLLHGVSAIQLQLPSAVRYHLTIVPYALMSILAFSAKFTLKRKPSKIKISQVISIPLSIFLVFVLNTSDYGGIVPENSNYILSKTTSEWYLKALPNCVNTKIDAKILHSDNRSFIFVKRSGTASAMDDTLLFLSEQPMNLKGRTFQQWRYTTGVLNANLLSSVGSSPLFNRPLLSDDVNNILKLSKITNSPFIVSTQTISSPNLLYVGMCKFPLKLKNVIDRNATLGQNVHIYFSESTNESDLLMLQSQEFSSSRATFNFVCKMQGCLNMKNVELTLNFNQYLRASLNDQPVLISPNEENAVKILTKLCCKTGDENLLKFYSYSSLNFTKNVVLVFLLLMSLAAGVSFKRIVA